MTYSGWLENSFVVAWETRIRAASNKLLCPVSLDHAISLCSVLCKGQAVSYQVMVSVVDVGPQVKRSGFKTWAGQCVIFLDKTLYFQNSSLYKWVQENCQGNLLKFWAVTSLWTNILPRGE